MLKIILVGLIALCTVLGAVTDSGILTFVILIGGAVSAGCIYVTFGWLEQTLLLLIVIAHHRVEEAHN